MSMKKTNIPAGKVRMLAKKPVAGAGGAFTAVRRQHRAMASGASRKALASIWAVSSSLGLRAEHRADAGFGV